MAAGDVMRVLVYPHDLGMGGSQLNAIELAAAVRDLGHEVVIYGQPGTLISRIDQLGLEFIGSPDPGRRPSRVVVSDLHELARRRSIDLLHGYEWPPILESRMAALAGGTSCIGTVMSMAVAPFIPRQIPLVVGTRRIADVERHRGRASVAVIEPPIDLRTNQPDLEIDLGALARKYEIDINGPVVVVVTRLARELKLEGLLCAIRHIHRFDPAATLVVVGDGPERAVVEAAADEACGAAGRRAVVLTGQLVDPRAAYALADVVIGMGGSILRGMAFGKPVVVQGELGYWRALTPQSLPDFQWTGWYGVGAGPAVGPAALKRELLPLLSDPGLRAERGRFSLDVVRDGYSLAAAAYAQVEVYAQACDGRAGQRVNPRDDLAGALRLVAHVTRRRLTRLRGRVNADDFNANPMSLTGASS